MRDRDVFQELEEDEVQELFRHNDDDEKDGKKKKKPMTEQTMLRRKTVRVPYVRVRSV